MYSIQRAGYWCRVLHTETEYTCTGYVEKKIKAFKSENDSEIKKLFHCMCMIPLSRIQHQDVNRLVFFSKELYEKHKFVEL